MNLHAKKSIHKDTNGVEVFCVSRCSAANDYEIAAGVHRFAVHFQNGPVHENGINGVTNEALLAILICRTEYLNTLMASPLNETALAGMRQALEAFESRTKKRRDAGVEGTNIPLPDQA